MITVRVQVDAVAGEAMAIKEALALNHYLFLRSLGGDGQKG